MRARCQGGRFDRCRMPWWCVRMCTRDYEMFMCMPWWLHAAPLPSWWYECRGVHGDAACRAEAMCERSRATSSRERSRAGSRAVSRAWSQAARSTSRTVFSGSSLLKYNDYNIQIGNRHTFFLSKQAPKALESLRSFYNHIFNLTKLVISHKS